MLEIDHDGAILFATGTVRGLLGVDAELLIGKRLGTIVAPESAQALATVLSAATTGRRVLVDIVLQLGSRRAGGNIAGCPTPPTARATICRSAPSSARPPRRAAPDARRPSRRATRPPAC
ncbi:MAG: PAS domain-containing protein [Pseudomonadota bacterium]